MVILYFEKQFGALCGRHCLNNALQQNVFTEVDLAKIGEELDEEERRVMRLAGQPSLGPYSSANYDDTGFFSIQVLQQALRNMNMIMAPFFNSPGEEPRNPVEERLFIINMENHWFSFRRFQKTWVELNSLSKQPKYISDTYLVEYLASLKNEGHSVFVVTGEIPMCSCDIWSEFDQAREAVGEVVKPPSVDTVRDGEEGLTKEQIVRKRREQLLQNVEKKMGGVSLSSSPGGSSAGPSSSATTTGPSIPGGAAPSIIIDGGWGGYLLGSGGNTSGE